MAGYRYRTTVARRRRGRRSRPLFRAYYAREDTSLTPPIRSSPPRRGYRHSRHAGIALLPLSRTPEPARSARFARHDATRRRAFDGSLRSPVNARGEVGPPARYLEGGHSTWTRQNHPGWIVADPSRAVCVHAKRRCALTPRRTPKIPSRY